MTLVLRDISLGYNGRPVLKNINLEIDDGEFLVLLGPSGAGKSKILEVIAGLAKPDDGQIILNGKEVNDVPTQQRNMGIVFQDYALFPHMTVYDNISFGLKVRKEDNIDKRVREVAEGVMIQDLLDRYPGELSGGQSQRAAVARALAKRPEVLLLDEPLSALDANVREGLRNLIKGVQKSYKLTTIYVTHDYIEAVALADRIAMIREGALQQVGRPDDLFYRPKTRHVAEFTMTYNIFDGQVVESSDERTVVSIGIDVLVEKKIKSKYTTICIRPEDIMIIRPERPSSFINTYTGIIEKIESLGIAAFRLYVDVGITLTVHVPRHVVERLDLMKGKTIEVSMKKEKIHIIE